MRDARFDNAVAIATASTSIPFGRIKNMNIASRKMLSTAPIIIPKLASFEFPTERIRCPSVPASIAGIPPKTII